MEAPPALSAGYIDRLRLSREMLLLFGAALFRTALLRATLSISYHKKWRDKDIFSRDKVPAPLACRPALPAPRATRLELVRNPG